ncbi:MAG: TonB-dependent receptor [Flavobacteriales bacterium]|nr:TonB-dependent receptor [Flavobacteriales bacterium]
MMLYLRPHNREQLAILMTRTFTMTFASLRTRGICFFALAAMLFTLSASTVHAQVSSGTLKGEVTNNETGETLPFVNVVLFLNGNQVTGVTTDFDGKYTIKPIDPGTYDILFSFVGFTPKRVQGVKVTANKIRFVDATLSEGVLIDEAEVVTYTVPLIDRDGGASGGTVTREDIEKLPGRDATTVAATVAGVGTTGTGGGVSIRGARTSSTWYYIDGVKVRGSAALPKSAIEEVSVITGGVPANIGDVTGGIISISLRSSSSKWFGGAEVISSGIPIGDDRTIGFDDYGYNLVEGTLSGPIMFRKDENGEKTSPLLGLFFSGNFANNTDGRPTFGGLYAMKEEVRQELLANPLRQNINQATGEVNGALYNADFLGADAFEKVYTRKNVAGTSANMVAKIDVNTSDMVSLTFGGNAAYSKGHGFSYENSLMNWENNQLNSSLTWRAYAKFAQRFQAQEGETSGGLNNVYYSVMVDYSKSTSRSEDDTHLDNFMRYGHVGSFDVVSRNDYEFDFARQVFRHSGWEDTAVYFMPSQYNGDMAAITNQYFNLFDRQPYNAAVDGPYDNLLEVQNNALINGQGPSSTYGLWTYLGTQNNSYGVSDNSQFRISAAGSADIKDHAVQLGFEYEQRRDAFFSLAPGGLWTLARLNTNSHIKELDLSDSTITNVGTGYYVTYDRLIGDNQFEVDRNLRISLGLDPDGNDYINVDALDPSQISLDFFGADDLLNQGSNYVNYSGFDPYGNSMLGRPTIEEFFNETNDAGFRTRPIGAYEPIYIAGYVMDKFTFDDIIFNVGVRVDRFDANQPVPKDPYVIGESYVLSDVQGGLLESLNADYEVPSNIGDDFAVYVDALDGPANVVGFRDGDTWYNALGTEIQDPDILAVNERYPAPWLVEGPDAELTSKAFRDYEPQVNIMPRVAFSFNISDEAVFFAHYDVLTQRPTSSNRFSPIDYLFMENRSSLISNPDLRPEKTVDYELGFQQVLTKTSSLKLSTFYKELRDMIQVRSYTGAYPRPYRAFGNLDFGTVKGFSVQYDMRRTGNVRLNANYTLQFADGTGSTTETALALINAGLPNLRTITPLNYDQRHRIVLNVDYRYGGGDDYNGPMFKGKQILANTGMNFITNLGSGTPYTAQTIATPITGEISPSTEGSLNGSRLPWQVTLNMNIDKSWAVKFGGDDKKGGEAFVNAYLWISNVLNIQNITGVYRFTGTPDDDGYLAAAQYQPQINGKNDPDAFRNYYGMYVDNPFNYGVPRTIRLGVKLDF